MDARRRKTFAVLWMLVGCSESDAEGMLAAGGGSGGSGLAGSGGMQPAAGGATAGGGTGASSSGGASGSGGNGGVSGTGAAGGGAAGSAGSAGATSAGCGKSGPPSGERQLQIAGHTGLYIVSLPPGYDSETAYPLGFGFHGRNRNHANCQAGDCAGFQAELGETAVLVYLQSLRTPTDNEMGGWEATEEREGNVQFFEAVLASVLAEYCIDQRRVFVAGTSSGASFSNLLACRLGDRLLATAPVAGYMPETESCTGKPAALVIHGIDDPHVTFASGEVARAFYVARNGCGNTTLPDLAGMHAEIRASRDSMQETHGCVDYQGCDQGSPVRWCEHSYGGYDGSTHGWPPNGGTLIREFLERLD